MSIHRDRPTVRLIEARDKIRNRRFSCARGTDKGDHLAGRGLERHTVERLASFLVGERDILETHAPRHRGKRLGVGTVRNALREIDNGEHAVHGSHCLLQIPVNA